MRRNPLRGPNWLIGLAVIILILVFIGMTFAKEAIDREAERENISRLKRLEQKLDGTLKKTQAEQKKLDLENKQLKNEAGSLKQENDQLHNEVGRVYTLRDYLASYGSPMAEHANDIYKSGKKYGVKPAVVVAIAFKESTLAKANGLKDGWSVWGWSGKLDTSSPEALIDSYTRAIATEYPRLAQGDIYSATSYCVPPDAWMADVSSIFNDLEARGV